MFCRLMHVMLLVLMTWVPQSTPITIAQGITYADPFAYCEAVGTIDVADSRYAGPKVPESIARGLRTATQASPDAPLNQFIVGSSWRCMDGKVYACTVGANLPCEERASTDKTPTPSMAQFCQTNLDDPIPGFITGGASVYAWSCVSGVATPGGQVLQVDSRGFIANIWYAIGSANTTGPQTMPHTGGAEAFNTGNMLVVVGVLVVLIGLIVRRRSVCDVATP